MERLTAGLIALSLSCLIVVYGWPLLVTQPYIKERAYWIGLIVFTFTGLMISTAAEAMRRANARAKQAQDQAQAANAAKSTFWPI